MRQLHWPSSHDILAQLKKQLVPDRKHRYYITVCAKKLTKDDGGGSDKRSYKSCKAPVKSSPPTNQHPAFYRPDALPVSQPTVSEHWRKNCKQMNYVRSANISCESTFAKNIRKPTHTLHNSVYHYFFCYFILLTTSVINPCHPKETSRAPVHDSGSRLMQNYFVKLVRNFDG